MLDKWCLITINDLKFLPGKSIFDIFKLILKIIKFRFVAMDNLYGVGIASLFQRENDILEIDTFLNMLCEVIQFDWADFFLFIEYPTQWINIEDMSYPEIITQTNTTIRAVDDQYIYIYTPYKQIVHLIEESYEIESLKMDVLEKLDYPY